MPLTEKGERVMRAMQAQYGEKRGAEVFYASRNAGTISGVDTDEVPAEAFERLSGMIDTVAALAQRVDAICKEPSK